MSDMNVIIRITNQVTLYMFDLYIIYYDTCMWGYEVVPAQDFTFMRVVRNSQLTITS